MGISPVSSVSGMQRSAPVQDDATMLDKLQKLLDQLQQQLQKIKEMDTDSITQQQQEETLRSRIAQVYAEIMAMKAGM